MSEPLRFGIVGCGVIGPLQADAVASLPDAQLAAVADIVPERAQHLAGRYGATPYTDLDSMLERERLDVVIICTPSGKHGEHACQVMRSGRHVIVEKPMEIRLEAIDEMLRVQQETGVKLAVISQHRFDPASQQIRRLLDEKALGRLVLGHTIVPWWRSQKYYDSGAWRGTWSLDGGGVLMNQAIHSIDLLQWLMGPVQSIYAYTDTLVHKMETEDVAVAVLRFTNGAIGTVAATTGTFPGVTTRIEIFGNQGAAVLENDILSYLHLARDSQEEIGNYGIDPKKLQERTSSHENRESSEPIKEKTNEKKRNASISTAQDPSALQSTTHALQIADMIRAIREDGTPLIDGIAGRHPVDIILGIYESARTGKEVYL